MSMEQRSSTETRDKRAASSEWRRYFGAAVLGVTLAGGLANLRGTYTELGPATVNTKLGFGDTTARYGADAIKIDNPYPPLPGANVDVIQVEDFQGQSFENFKDLAPYIQDTETIQRHIASDVFLYNFQTMCSGAALAILIRRMVQLNQPPHLPNIYKAAIPLVPAFAAAYSLYLPYEMNAGRKWKSPTVYNTQLGDVSVNGPITNASINVIASSEEYYNKIQTNFQEVLPEVADEDKARGDSAMLFMTDHHCNMGQYRNIETIASSLNIDTLINGGDETTNTPLDTLCLDIRRDRLNGIENRISILGNHDNNSIKKKYEAAGETVLDSTSQTVNGVKILGFTDPTETPFNSETRLRGNRTQREYQANVARISQTSSPDIAVIHNPDNASAATPYATLTLSGHTHRADGPTQKGVNTWAYTGGTSGGEGSGSGDRRATAVETLDIQSSYLVIYTKDGTLTGTRQLTIQPDTSVEIGEFSPLEYEDIPEIAPNIPL